MSPTRADVIFRDAPARSLSVRSILPGRPEPGISVPGNLQVALQ